MFRTLTNPRRELFPLDRFEVTYPVSSFNRALSSRTSVQGGASLLAMTILRTQVGGI
jgi:hypothetical protein